MYHIIHFLIGFTTIVMGYFFVVAAKNMFMIEIEDECEVVIAKFGKIDRVLTEPGAHFYPRFLPWVHVITVSKKRDFRHYKELFMNDSRGATMIVDLWPELRIVDSTKALFSVENWEDSLQGLMINCASTLLSSFEFQEIHTQRMEIGEKLREEIRPIALRWGIEVDRIFIREIKLLPEVSRQMFIAVAAKLERFKSKVEEEGRLKIAHLEAQTSIQIAALKSEAKAKYPLAVSLAYKKLLSSPKVLSAYRELYELAQIRPHRTSSFVGFRAGELNEMETVSAVTERFPN